MRRFALAAVAALASSPAVADTIERACLQSDRPGTSRMLCGCIQDVADLTLTKTDQKRAAKFFADPHQAQVVRQSDSRRDEVFWTRYRSFGESAQQYCSS